MSSSRRSGKTLIELMLVITVLGMVMGIAGKTMVVVLNKERSGEDAFIANSDRARLAGDFRRDVNAAASAGLPGEADNAGRRLELKLPENRTVEYTLNDDEVTRLETRDETVLRQERYHLAHDSGQFAIETGAHELVSFTASILRRPENSSAPPRQLRMEAVTGKDLRFQAEGTP